MWRHPLKVFGDFSTRLVQHSADNLPPKHRKNEEEGKKTSSKLIHIWCVDTQWVILWFYLPVLGRLNDTILKYGDAYSIRFHCSTHFSTKKNLFSTDFKHMKEKNWTSKEKNYAKLFFVLLFLFPYIFFLRDTYEQRQKLWIYQTFRLSIDLLDRTTHNLDTRRWVATSFQQISQFFSLEMILNRRNEDQWKIFSLTQMKIHSVGQQLTWGGLEVRWWGNQGKIEVDEIEEDARGNWEMENLGKFHEATAAVGGNIIFNRSPKALHVISWELLLKC
jgi:hypothetical protein